MTPGTKASLRALVELVDQSCHARTQSAEKQLDLRARVARIVLGKRCRAPHDEDVLDGPVKRKKLGPHGGAFRRALGAKLLMMFLDEPSTGLDAGARRNMRKSIEEASLNRTLVLAAHTPWRRPSRSAPRSAW